MRLNQTLFLFAVTILCTLACSTRDLSQPSPTSMSFEAPIELQTIPPLSSWTAIPTPISTDMTAEPIPAWVADFANPILIETADRRPNFQDDFSRYRGWLLMLSNVKGSFYAELQDGMLLLKLPERTEDSFVYNPKINRRNFVLTLDLRFYHDQPNDRVRFQFDQSMDQSVVLDLSNNRNWGFRWGPEGNRQSISGIYQHFPPEHIPVTIIMLGTQCAVYLNHDPLVYSESCRENPIPQSKVGTVTFHLLRDNANAVVVNFDNVKLWDLDKILSLP